MSVDRMEDPDEIDSIRDNDEELIEMQDLHQKLMELDEEIGSDEFEALKFLCRDLIPVSRLQKAQCPLDVFIEMKKQVLIGNNNLDFLLELLGCIHRFDLIRRLELDATEVRSRLHTFNKLDPFRKLLLMIIEELDEKETDRVRFYLRGKIRKKMFNEKQSPLDLMIYLEQEGLIANDNVDLLIDIMETLRRGDLVEKIQEYQGIPSPRLGGSECQPFNRGNQPLPPPLFQPIYDTTNQQARLVQGGDSARNGEIGRSPSAGTLSVSSEGTPDQLVGGILPDALFHQIVDEVKEQDENLAMELGYSNNQIVEYRKKYVDKAQRTRRYILDWEAKHGDKGSVVPKLSYAVRKLGCKKSSVAIKQWTDSFQFPMPSMPAITSEENNYSSLRHAQPVGAQNPPLNYEENLVRDLNNLGISPENIPQNNDVKFVDDIALYQMAGKIVANPGISQQLKPMTATINTGQIPACGPGATPSQLPAKVNMVNTGTSAQVIVPVTEALPRYRMDRKPRGWCVIINNEQFNVASDVDAKEMPPRMGTEKDAESLSATFEKLNFIVRRHDNLTDVEMVSTLVDVAHNVRHDKFDCFVCCILTHGVLNNLYGSNGKLVSIKDLTMTFQANRCPSLAGKPKLFFFQACQGRDKMTGGTVERDGPNDHLTGPMQNIREMIPNEADFLLGFATVPGYVSFRSRNQGSWYIRKLCELLNKYALKHDLMSILTELNRVVGNANANLDNGIYKQCPAPLVTLRKQLFFM